MKNDIETRADIDDLMNRFYARAINDETIGYIFTDVAKLDLEHHLPVIGDFWETLLFGTGNYQKHGRNPLQVHAVLHQKSPLSARHFRRWLELFRETVDQSFAGERAGFIKLRAEAIANRMLNFVSGVPAISAE
ncbi:MAG: group III truncated hemoglobin [Acidobacteria bacterium]|nr:group III truncated hemoglobin [Acidobacteriota bacterium]MBA4185820.1 group III truncated hemoglobin [Acidobacteriota bacterium]